MKNKETNTIIRVFGILGIIFCLFSLLTPWSNSAFTFGIFSGEYSSPFYIDIFTSQSIRDSDFFFQELFFSIAMIIILIFTIIALILGIISIGKVEMEVPSTFLLISSIFIVNIILYITAVSLCSDNISYADISYGIGFITAIIAFIIFFILFILKSVFHEKTHEMQKTKLENEAINILKIRYAKGEITKEKYEQMKKEIQD